MLVLCGECRNTEKMFVAGVNPATFCKDSVAFVKQMQRHANWLERDSVDCCSSHALEESLPNTNRALM